MLQRCKKCSQAVCKYCLIKDFKLRQDPDSGKANDIVLRSVLNLLEIKYDVG